MMQSKGQLYANNRWRAIRGVIVLMSMVVSGCASNQKMSAATESRMGIARVTGTIAYRVRMILPQDALARLDLVDISRKGAPGLTIGLQQFEIAGRQVPIPFEIVYRQADIDPTHTYAIEARILHGQRLLFGNSHTYKVITNGLVSDIQIVMEQMPGG